MEKEKSVCPICGETQEDWDDSIDWTCPNLCHVGKELLDGEIYSKISWLDEVKDKVRKETEQRILNEFAKDLELLSCNRADDGKGNSKYDIEQLREKYKGVE
jgi:hypothetical protein